MHVATLHNGDKLYRKIDFLESEPVEIEFGTHPEA